MRRRIQVGDLRIGSEERKAVNEVLDSGRISEGEKTREFEKAWAEYIGTKYCVAASSGNSALMMAHRALQAMGEIKDNTAITTPLSYIATTSSLLAAGIKPFYVDVDRNTFNITAEWIEECDSRPNTNFAVPVHLFGVPTDIKEIQELGYTVLEDASQAHGATVNGKKVGSLGIGGVFSFYIAHTIAVGEMGAVTTDSKEMQTLMRQIKAQGRACNCEICTRPKGYCPKLTESFDPRFSHELIGWNLKTTEFMTAIGLVKLKHIEEIIHKRRENVKYLNDVLPEVGFTKPPLNEGVSPMVYPIVCEGISRNKLRLHLEKSGIETRPFFPCIPDQPAFPPNTHNLPNARYLADNGLYFGIHENLTEEDLEHIERTFRRYLL